MREKEYVIKDAQGIHARPAGQLVKLAQEYPCSITVTNKGKEVDAKRILGVMSLGDHWQIFRGKYVGVSWNGSSNGQECIRRHSYRKT